MVERMVKESTLQVQVRLSFYLGTVIGVFCGLMLARFI